MTGLFGSVFDPPHIGHEAVLRRAREHFALKPVVILVVADPGHKEVTTEAGVRLELARAAFPDEQVELDPHPRTVDMLRERRFGDPIFLVGADEFCDFLRWKEPDGVLELARLGVATRPGYPRERLEEPADDRWVEDAFAVGDAVESVDEQGDVGYPFLEQVAAARGVLLEELDCVARCQVLREDEDADLRVSGPDLAGGD